MGGHRGIVLAVVFDFWVTTDDCDLPLLRFGSMVVLFDDSMNQAAPMVVEVEIVCTMVMRVVMVIGMFGDLGLGQGRGRGNLPLPSLLHIEI